MFLRVEMKCLRSLVGVSRLDQVGKNTHFREINISTKTSEFVVSFGNL